MLESAKDKRKRERKKQRAKKKEEKRDTTPPVRFGSIAFYKLLYARYKNMPKKYKYMLWTMFVFGSLIMWLGPLKQPAQKAAQVVVHVFDFRPYFEPFWEYVRTFVREGWARWIVLGTMISFISAPFLLF